ncbi:MAG: alpha/beta fold hydrolase [Pseudomonadota bacterium]
MSAVLVALHGANGSAATMAPLLEQLNPAIPVFVPEWPGHGGRSLPERLDVRTVAMDVLAQMDERGLERAAFFGYSLGGLVALYLARHFPQRTLGVATLATRVVFDDDAIKHLLHVSEPERLKKIPNRPFLLQARHAPNRWEDVIAMNRQLFSGLQAQPPVLGYDLSQIQAPALVMCGDKDSLVTTGEAREVARLLGADTWVFAGPSHPITSCPLNTIAQKIEHWYRASVKSRS